MAESHRPAAEGGLEIWVWRHPRAVGAEGRCIGHTDFPVDRRRVKRLAHRIEREARRHGLPRVVWSSPLARCAAVGRALRRRGFVHHIDARLAELDFGSWEGRDWRDIPAAEIARWEAGFSSFAPGGGESLVQLVLRTRAFLADRAADQAARVLLVVGHAGWINTLGLDPQNLPDAAHWPSAPGHGALVRHGLET
jgi:alpha-ribazole phosphatase